MNWKKAHPTILAVAAAYLLYLAYGLLRDPGESDAAMPPWLRILFIALFALAAVGLLAYAFLEWRRGRSGDGEGDEENLK